MSFTEDEHKRYQERLDGEARIKAMAQFGRDIAAGFNDWAARFHENLARENARFEEWKTAQVAPQPEPQKAVDPTCDDPTHDHSQSSCRGLARHLTRAERSGLRAVWLMAGGHLVLRVDDNEYPYVDVWFEKGGVVASGRSNALSPKAILLWQM